MKRVLLAFTALLLVFSRPAATQSTGGEKIGTLDFYITAPDGSVPQALTPADLSLKIGGRPQRISSVELVTPKSGPRHVVLLVDEATLYALEPIVKDAVAKLLASLAPGDTAAFYSTRGTQITLTTDLKKITAAVENLKTGPGVLYPCQRDLMKMIATDSAQLPPGRATSMAVISRGHPEGPSVAGDSDVAPCTPRRDDLRHLEEAISMAQINLHFFTVDAVQRSWGFDNIAANTGATSGLLTWSNHDGLARAIESFGTFYRLTFAWDTQNNRMQRVDLRATGKRLKTKASPWLRVK
jgi:hypothetical protein